MLIPPFLMSAAVYSGLCSGEAEGADYFEILPDTFCKFMDSALY
jgi:hypothetical protein